MKTHFYKLFTIIILLGLAGCQSIDVRGQFVSDKAIQEINTKKLGKKEVVNLIGTPTYTPDYSKNTWYYIQRSMARRAWFTPTVNHQRVVKVIFAGNNKALRAVLIEGEQNEKISAVSNYTKAHGTEKNGIQKFVKNIGRFNKTTDGSNRRKKKK
ncbi:outer membrane protein assembly factor BamE [Rickettsiaceae bacterium]|nr:outer membrane protein assembly factor BamE [Rickettsiaceae bacterium]